MNSLALAREALREASVRLEALELLYQRESYDDVVREAQEIVELVLKGALR
ncbi:MAG: HEPN domain-containing protein [candidate division WOR-3 bacterium]